MRVVICGGGMVGSELTRRLVRLKHDVVLIDRDKSVCDKLYAELGVVAIHGSAGSLEILREAEADKAELVVAATNNDADNLSSAILCRSLGVPHIISRVNDANYESAFKLLNIDGLIWGTNLMVNQILMEIEHPRAKNISTVAQGRASIFSVTVPKGAKVAYKQVKDVALMPGFPSQCVLMGVYSMTGDKFTIPRGSQTIHEGDEIFIITFSKDMEKVIDLLTMPSESGT